MRRVSNGHPSGNGFTQGDKRRVTKRRPREHTLAMILNWLRRHRGPSTGDARRERPLEIP